MGKFKPQYRRLLFIDRRLREARFPNCRTLAEEWEVSTKTIMRDIEYLRDELGAPLDYDRTEHGYYYREPHYRLPAISVNESDLFALCIADRALKQFENTPLHATLASVFGKIEETLPDQVKINPEWIDNRIFFFPDPATAVNMEIWENVARAIRENRQLLITHTSPSKRPTTERTVDPYHLVNFRGEWYLSSYCHKRESIRTFGVSRITHAELLDETFDMPAEYDHETMFGDQVGIIWSETFHTVRIRFDVRLAPYIRERTWHPDQSIKENKDGSLVLSFRTNHLNETQDWILSWGAGAKALAPKALVTRVTHSLRDSLSRYM